MLELQNAWRWREDRGILAKNEAVRVFHGPGEGQGDWQSISIDRFAEHYWVTEWESSSSSTQSQLKDFLLSKGARSAVLLARPERGIASESRILFGSPPGDRWSVRENKSQFLIQLEKTRHPGLFLDHEPLRHWLENHMRGLRVLNTFAYTGSLSVAAVQGGAQAVTTLDLSKGSIEWAKANFKLNAFDESPHRFIAGDVFEWLPRLKRRDEVFDCVILDPPSFSHGNKQKFSTAKDLVTLHRLAMGLLAEEGLLITSINSANIPWRKFEEDVLTAGQAQNMKFKVLRQIDLPETFPTRLENPSSRYLKGWILQRSKSSGRGSSNLKSSPEIGWKNSK